MATNVEESTLTTTILLGCDPQVLMTILQNGEGTEADPYTLHFTLTNPETGEPVDIDGLFFDFDDDSLIDSSQVHPGVNDPVDDQYGSETPLVTGFDTGDGDQDSLPCGIEVEGDYDAMVQFGLADDSTEGCTDLVQFTLWTDEPGGISIDDLDLESFAVVVEDSDGDGWVLTPNDEDGEEGGGGDDDVDAITGEIDGELDIELTLTEVYNEDTGLTEIRVDLSVGEDGDIGDLRGLFLNIEDESLLNGLSVTGDDVTGSEFNANSVGDLGKGVNMNGQGGKFDLGVMLGTNGIGDDDLQSVSFTLSHDSEDLEVEDFAGESFGVRLTSVGEEGGDREDSLKLTGDLGDLLIPDCPNQYELEIPEDCQCDDEDFTAEMMVA
ncbi:MAG: hypothetical protein R3256_02145 [Thalassovita sp.]|nr:hypothetical protein [Thalassovita sp.]